MAIASHRDLVVWQKSMKLATEVYRVSKFLPGSEQYRLTSQLLRAVTSVPANIAEGHARGTRKDYANFISIARGSLAEVDTLLELASCVELLKQSEVAPALGLSDEVGRMLTALYTRLREAAPKT